MREVRLTEYLLARDADGVQHALLQFERVGVLQEWDNPYNAAEIALLERPGAPRVVIPRGKVRAA